MITMLVDDFRQTRPVISRSTVADEKRLLEVIEFVDIHTWKLSSWQRTCESRYRMTNRQKYFPSILLDIGDGKILVDTFTGLISFVPNFRQWHLIVGKFKGETILIPRIALLPQLTFLLNLCVSGFRSVLRTRHDDQKSLEICEINLELTCFFYVLDSRETIGPNRFLSERKLKNAVH